LKFPKICPVCGDTVTKYNYFMIPIERPYCNLFVHKGCVKTFRSYDVDYTTALKLCKGELILEEAKDDKQG